MVGRGFGHAASGQAYGVASGRGRRAGGALGRAIKRRRHGHGPQEKCAARVDRRAGSKRQD